MAARAAASGRPSAGGPLRQGPSSARHALAAVRGGRAGRGRGRAFLRRLSGATRSGPARGASPGRGAVRGPPRRAGGSGAALPGCRALAASPPVSAVPVRGSAGGPASAPSGLHFVLFLKRRRRLRVKTGVCSRRRAAGARRGCGAARGG